MTDAWCILRTSGRHTLELADSLTKDGFEAWTPRAVLPRRLPRKRTVVEVHAPIMPTYVFCSADRLSDLLMLSERGRKAQPDFSVFTYLRTVPLIAEAELASLRGSEAKFAHDTEARRAKEKMRHRLPMRSTGEPVRIEKGPFAGMSGVVEGDDGKFTLVLFGSTSVKIAAFLLAPDVANTEPVAAKAA